ncbi:hypothetical protein FX983_00003 [Pseudomonas frederiksbergensis]|uniref:Uncharacterized protein n=1 Tax=Pseudomonas frederiksbergensis TaxID=104087 RepID=A0A6L5BVK8_9PSED|nr:hypothetical protein FX983_00003 [Pseudomonas frederiksbergensis]
MGRGRHGRRGNHDAGAASDAGDGDVDLGRVIIDGVVRRQWYVDGAGSLTGLDHDHRAVGQSDGQVAGRCLRQGCGVNQYATGLGDGRRGGQAQGRCLHDVGVIGGLAANGVLGDSPGSADACGREANGRVYPASGRVQHDEAVATTGRAVAACCGRAGSGGFEVCGRVGAGNDGLLQFFNRWRGLCSGFCQVSAGIRIGATPLSVAAQVQGPAISQFEGYGASGTGVYLIADKQPIAFNEYATDALWGHRENLTNNAFDDGNNTAH